MGRTITTLSNKRSTSTSVAVSRNGESPSSRFDWQPTPATFLPLPKCQQRSSVPLFCSVLFTLSGAKDSSQAAPSRLVLLRQSLKNTQTWPVLVWCPGYCDRHVSLFPYGPEHRERSELLHHLRFVADAAFSLCPLFFFVFYYRQKCRQYCPDLCKGEW